MYVKQPVLVGSIPITDIECITNFSLKTASSLPLPPLRASPSSSDDYQTFLPHLVFDLTPTPICCQAASPLCEPDRSLSFSGTEGCIHLQYPPLQLSRITHGSPNTHAVLQGHDFAHDNASIVQMSFLPLLPPAGELILKTW